jgi:sialate O-acetylesterase
MSDLWILAGQSNMQGYGKLVGVETPSSHVRCFAMGDVWKQAEEPLHWLPEAVDPVHHEGMQGEELEAYRKEYRQIRDRGAGLALSFAKTINERIGVDIDLVPTAHGGSAMFQWSPKLKTSGGKSLYGALLRQVNAALETGGDIRLAGVLWYQGESDANPEHADQYLQRTQHIIQELRTDFSAPNLPFYLVQIGCWSTDLQTAEYLGPYWDRVREAQRLLPTLTHHTAVVSAIDLELADVIHIDTSGLKRLGVRLANIALNQHYGREAATGPKLRSVVNEGNRIRVSFDDVSRMLITPDRAGRVFGFSLGTGDRLPSSSKFFGSYIDPMSPSDVILEFEGTLPSNATLYYGSGLFPTCQLADAVDMPVPAFGPVAIS